jgi:hypothetical protein
MKFKKNGITITVDNPNTYNVFIRNGFEKVEDEELSYQDLKSLAKEKGINTHGMKKEEILEALGM